MKKAKEFILGALVGSMVMGGCVTAFGSNGTKTIQAVYKNIKVIVDGKELKTDKEPFTYEGTTYLPVRAVAEAVGKEVKWDSATQTVILGSGIAEKTTEESPAEAKKSPAEAKKGPVVLGKGIYTVGKEIVAGNYDLKCTSGTTNIFGKVASLGANGLNIIMWDDKEGDFPKMDTYYIYPGLSLKDGDTIEINDADAKIEFTLK